MDDVLELVRTRPGADCIQAASQTEATQIYERIYMSTGTSNAYMLVTEAGRVILNTGLGFEALTHKRVFDAVCSGPTPYIITTQGHVDHVGGVDHFREPGTQYVAQRNLPSCQHDDERIADRRQSQSYIWFSSVIDHALTIADQHPEVLIQDRPVADIMFDARHTLEVGGLQLELIATPGGETIDSCVVWLPDERILFTGNLFGPLFPHFPNFNTIRGDKYRDVERFLASLDTVAALRPDVLITGHGDPIEGADLIATCLTRIRDAVTFVHDKTLRGMAEGRRIEDLEREISLPPELAVGQGYGRVAWAVRTIWESYMGWFKASATSELYPTAERDLYAELADLAGIPALLSLGRDKLTSDPVATTILADMVLAREPHHRDALTLQIEAHEALVARDGENFWLRGWLQHRMAQCRDTLADLDAGEVYDDLADDTVARLFAKLPGAFRADQAEGISTRLRFVVSGEQASTWTLVIEDQRCTVTEGSEGTSDCDIHIGEVQLVGLMTGKMTPLRALVSGKLWVEGDKIQARLLDTLFVRNLTLDEAPAAPTRIHIDDLHAPRLSWTQSAALALTRLAPVRFTEAAVLDAARRRTGLSDFGPEDYRVRLGLLLQDYDSDTGMTALGRRTVFDALVRYASNRLLIQQRLTDHPEILDEPIEAPIIIAGLPRSGTTHLLNLLAADDRLRSLPLWESYEPVPSSYGRTSARLANVSRHVASWWPGRSRDVHRDDRFHDPRYVRCAAQWEMMQAVAPHLAAMHPMDPDHIHEELELMGPDFASYLFEWTAIVPRFRDHYLATDQTPHYAYMKRVLQLLQWGQPRRRWVLKCPQHLEQLSVLRATFPDATVVFTHRDPAATIQSSATMLAYAQRMNRHQVDAHALATYWADRVEQLLRGCVRDRSLFADAASHDVLFHAFTRDNAATVSTIYETAGLELTDEARRAHQDFIAHHPRGKFGRIHYDLAGQLGLDPRALRERFAFYFDRFPIQTEST